MSVLRAAPTCSLATILAMTSLIACKTTPDNGSSGNPFASEAPAPTPPPQIYANMPLDKALQAGIEFGGDTLSDVKRLIKRRNEGEKAGPLMAAALHANLQTYEPYQLINAGHLYAAMPVAVGVPTFKELVASERPIARQLGWQIAAVKPSKALEQAIDRELTRALAENDDEMVMIPQMANAVRANHLKSAYTLVRQGLMAKGDEEFALAMMTLDPARASDDFLAYLALAPAEELRQLSLSSVNLYTCVAILRHMQKNAPSAGTGSFDHLFAFAVSRNTSLAELAQTVLESYVPHQTDLLAEMLAQQPAWVQIAYLENARRRMNPKQTLLLTELKQATSESDVVDEINEIKF